MPTNGAATVTERTQSFGSATARDRTQHKLSGAAFSADVQRVVTASEDETAQLWETETGKPLSEPLQHQGAVNSAVFSSDGRRVVTASDRTAQLWETETGEPVGAPLQHQGLAN